MQKTLFFLFVFLLSASLATADEGLKEIRAEDGGILINLKYATADNFMNEVLYEDDRCFLLESTADKLLAAQKSLQKSGYGLVVYDCYRPLAVQERMFKRYPYPGYVADPKKGSNHNRGAAVDVGLVTSAGELLPMPSEYDEFSERSHHAYLDTNKDRIKNRQLLRSHMTKAGFKPITTEWWHYNDPAKKEAPVKSTLIKDLPR